MGQTIIDGSNGNVSVLINSLQFKCVISRWAASISRQFTEKTTFCSGGWSDRDPGKKVMTGRIDGYLSKGAAASDPLALIAADDPSVNPTGLPFSLYADTGCYLSGNCHITQSDVASNAQLNGEMGISFESAGPVSSFWIVS